MRPKIQHYQNCRILHYAWDADKVVHVALVDAKGKAFAMCSAVIRGKVAYGFGAMRQSFVMDWRIWWLRKDLRGRFLKTLLTAVRRAGAKKFLGHSPAPIAKSHCEKYGFRDTKKRLRIRGLKHSLWLIEKDLSA